MRVPSSRSGRGTRPLAACPRRYGVWSRPSTVTVLCAAVPLNQCRQLGRALGVGVAAGVDDAAGARARTPRRAARRSARGRRRRAGRRRAPGTARRRTTCPGLTPPAALHVVARRHGKSTPRSTGACPRAPRWPTQRSSGTPRNRSASSSRSGWSCRSASESAGISPSGRCRCMANAAGQPQPVVVAGGHARPKRRAFSRAAEERAQRDEVVVRRALAVDAVGPHVAAAGCRAAAPRRDRRSSPSRVQARAAPSATTSRAYSSSVRWLRSACQVRPEVARPAPRCWPAAAPSPPAPAPDDRSAVEPLPGVHPVLQPPADHVARVVVRRDLGRSSAVTSVSQARR